MKTPMNTKHGYPVIFAIDEKRFPAESEYIVAHRGNDQFQPFAVWNRSKETGNTYFGRYFESLRDAEKDAIKRSGN